MLHDENGWFYISIAAALLLCSTSFDTDALLPEVSAKAVLQTAAADTENQSRVLIEDSKYDAVKEEETGLMIRLHYDRKDRQHPAYLVCFSPNEDGIADYPALHRRMSSSCFVSSQRWTATLCKRQLRF